MECIKPEPSAPAGPRASDIPEPSQAAVEAPEGISSFLLVDALGPKTIPQRIRFLKLEQCVFRGTLTPCIWTNTYDIYM